MSLKNFQVTWQPHHKPQNNVTWNGVVLKNFE